MFRSRRSNDGVTLIELLLVLAIMTSIIMVSMRFYLYLRRDSDVQQLQYNVDQLFQAAAHYYYANCRKKMDPLTGLQVGTSGTLDPTYVPAPANRYGVTVAALIAGGYLKSAPAINKLVNNGAVNGGYFVQFNKVTPIPDRTMTTSSGTVRLGQIILWRIQVSVNLANPTTVASYVSTLGAVCRSSLAGSGTTVRPCRNPAPPPGNYVVFERLPSYAVPNANSNLWMSNAAVKEFNEVFQTLPMLYLGSQPSSTYPQQYYLCGG